MLDEIQQQLEHTYGLRSEAKASDFLVDAEAAKALGGTARAREELLVAESEEGLELALYLHPSLQQPSSLGELCEVIEGVSHFLYVAHTAREERSVSLLELEAQAEVDKFVICSLFLPLPAQRGEGRGEGPARDAAPLLASPRFAGGGISELVRSLFDRITLHSHLTDAERWRYAEANRLARRYVQRLLPLFAAAKLEALFAELRRMYRLGAQAKLQYFALAR